MKKPCSLTSLPGHNYFVHRPADLLTGERTTLHGSDDGVTADPITTVLLNHTGSILKRFSPGQLISLTMGEVLTAAKTKEFGDSDSRPFYLLYIYEYI